ncbi:hypothetical protein KCP73_24295 [Salmonella enterica subsp. enterica]|nr:hypothetical protein KCP73_24295 [Salmonella enterica subsp. enterica]
MFDRTESPHDVLPSEGVRAGQRLIRSPVAVSSSLTFNAGKTHHVAAAIDIACFLPLLGDEFGFSGKLRL